MSSLAASLRIDRRRGTLLLLHARRVCDRGRTASMSLFVVTSLAPALPGPA
jgi:hypothetical protein